jgi:hypothetical protein
VDGCCFGKSPPVFELEILMLLNLLIALPIRQRSWSCYIPLLDNFDDVLSIPFFIIMQHFFIFGLRDPGIGHNFCLSVLLVITNTIMCQDLEVEHIDMRVNQLY